MPEVSTDARSLNSYPLHQCALYRLRNKRRLAWLLGTEWLQLKELLTRSDNYRCFDIAEGTKRRTVEEPKARLKRIHKRLLTLLQRIEAPQYLHSGVKRRSYITNARVHANDFRLAKLDVRKFYPSTKTEHVYGFFAEDLLCSSDVAATLAQLTTYKGHLPTGSPLSQILAFYSHKRMFDQIYGLADSEGAVMTCYVDDLTFSGNRVTGEFLYKVKRLIHGRGLEYHKEKRYAQGQPKLVTGVVVTGDGITAPHKQHKAICSTFDELHKCTDDSQRVNILERLLGRCNAANQVDLSFEARLHLANELYRRERNRIKKQQRRKRARSSAAIGETGEVGAN